MRLSITNGPKYLDGQWKCMGANLLSASTVLIPSIVKVQEVLHDALRMDTNLLKDIDVGVVDFILPAVTQWLNTNTNVTVILCTARV